MHFISCGRAVIECQQGGVNLGLGTMFQLLQAGIRETLLIFNLNLNICSSAVLKTFD